MKTPRKNPAMNEDRPAYRGAPAEDKEYRAKLQRLREAIIEGEKSGLAADSSIESILAELDAEFDSKR